jgi:hypothetical protein
MGSDGGFGQENGSLPRHLHRGILEAGGIAGGKELLRIGCGTTLTTQFFRMGKLEVKHALGRADSGPAAPVAIAVAVSRTCMMSTSLENQVGEEEPNIESPARAAYGTFPTIVEFL